MIGQIKGKVEQKVGREKKEKNGRGRGRKVKQKHMVWRNCKF